MSSSPFCLDFGHGKARSGHWDGSHASIQLEDATDFFFTLFSKITYQLACELDHSQTHKKFSDDARAVKHFNLHLGRAVPFAHNIAVSADSVGPYDYDEVLKPGDMMHHAHSINDPPPKSRPTVPKFDWFEPPKFHDLTAKELKNELKKTNLSTEGKLSDLRKRCKESKSPIETKKIQKKIK